MKFSDELYLTLKWICLVAIPALDTFLGILLPQVGVAQSVTTTVITIISGLGAFIGALIGISTTAYNNDNK